MSLVDDYYQWLLMAVDHVVPRGPVTLLGIPRRYYEDTINQVLTCSGCNGLDNRYLPPHTPQHAWSLAEFVAYRDIVFVERSQRIAQRREQEVAYFLSKTWTIPNPE